MLDVPSKVETRYIREHIEEVIMRRLLKKHPKFPEVEVDDAIFTHLVLKYKPITSRQVSKAKIPGFTEDDLRGILEMKLHQLLRRQKINLFRSDEEVGGLLRTSLGFLLIDMYRLMSKIADEPYHFDALDFALPISDKKL